MTTIRLGELVPPKKIVPYDNQKQKQIRNSAVNNFDTYVSSKGITVSHCEQSMAYSDLTEIYQRRFSYNSVNNASKQADENFTTSENYEKMIDSLTGATYYKDKNSREVKMTNVEFDKFLDYFGDNKTEAMFASREYQMKLAGKIKEYGDYTAWITDNVPPLLGIRDNKDNSSMLFENIGDPNKLFEELDKFYSKNNSKVDFDKFKMFMNQFTNGTCNIFAFDKES